jgi:hypothetical protein
MCQFPEELEESFEGRDPIARLIVLACCPLLAGLKIFFLNITIKVITEYRGEQVAYQELPIHT